MTKLILDLSGLSERDVDSFLTNLLYNTVYNPDSAIWSVISGVDLKKILLIDNDGKKFSLTIDKNVKEPHNVIQER